MQLKSFFVLLFLYFNVKCQDNSTVVCSGPHKISVKCPPCGHTCIEFRTDVDICSKAACFPEPRYCTCEDGFKVYPNTNLCVPQCMCPKTSQYNYENDEWLVKCCNESKINYD